MIEKREEKGNKQDNKNWETPKELGSEIYRSINSAKDLPERTPFPQNHSTNSKKKR